MEINVGARFNKVGTEEIVTVTKYDAQKGTVILKFPSGRSIPLSTGSLMKADKWRCIDDDAEEVKEEIKEEKPVAEKKSKKEKVKKEKVVKEKARKPLAKMSKSKIKTEVSDMLFNAVKECKDRDVMGYLRFVDKRKENKFEWEIISRTESKIGVIYFIDEKKFEVSFTDDIAKLVKGTEFDKLDIADGEFIEDKLKNFLNIIVEKVNNKESEEKTDGTI